MDGTTGGDSGGISGGTDIDCSSLNYVSQAECPEGACVWGHRGGYDEKCGTDCTVYSTEEECQGDCTWELFSGAGFFCANSVGGI